MAKAVCACVCVCVCVRVCDVAQAAYVKQQGKGTSCIREMHVAQAAYVKCMWHKLHT